MNKLLSSFHITNSTLHYILAGCTHTTNSTLHYILAGCTHIYHYTFLDYWVLLGCSLNICIPSSVITSM